MADTTPKMDMMLSEVLREVLRLQSDYSRDNTEAMQARGVLIRQTGPQRLREFLPESVQLDPADLDAEGSDGLGLRSRVPWMRVYSSSRSPSPRRGWYVAYLFAFDGSAVFLSLNQGTTVPSASSIKERADDFLLKRVRWATALLKAERGEVPSEPVSLGDTSGRGKGYETGNVAAIRYPIDAIPDDDTLRADLALFVDLLASVYSAEEDPKRSVGLPAYDDEDKPQAAGESAPGLEDVPAFIDWMRKRFGDELVPSRLEAEQEARDLLNAYAGAMSKEQALDLGRLFNKGVYGGIPRSNRFSPAFVGATMERVLEPLDEFNQWTHRLWSQNEDRALAAVDEILKTPTGFRGAGSSYTTMLMYLRDPEKYAVWLRITHDGLSALTDFSEPFDRSGGAERYLKFCDATRKFAAEHDVQPQELDAIFAQAARVATEKKRPPVVTKGAVKPVKGVTLSDVSKATYLPLEQLEEWVELVKGRKAQALFYGPPGTGKTFVAEQLATYLAGTSGRVERAQFHPSYSYEDFIEGLRPEVTRQGSMSYQVRPGTFRSFCESVRERDGTHVFIVDEINRAEIGSVLGELMQLLEYRGKDIVLPYSQELFSVPENVILLATMNTADRSLALVDFALRRRFHAFQLPPNRDVLAKWAAGRGAASQVVLKFFDLIQDSVADPDYAPGHSYWMTADLSADALFKVWKYELRPYLAEYWFEQRSQLDRLDIEVRELLAQET